MRSIRFLAVVVIFFSFALAPRDVDAQKLKVVSIVRLQNPDAVLRYARVSARNVPVLEFDFRSAFADELMTQFAAATKDVAEWRMATLDDSIPAVMFEKKNLPIPVHAGADRLLIVDIREYGIFRALGTGPRFNMQVEFRFIDKEGTKIWSKSNNVSGNGSGHTMDLAGKLDDIQKDDQKLLKEGLNAFVENFSAWIVKDQAAKVR